MKVLWDRMLRSLFALKCYISPALCGTQRIYRIFFLLSQRVPEYPGGHVHRYPVDPLTTHDPLFRHGEDEQISAKIVTILL